ncbi:TonB-dependent receptor plug domain-containing protein [Phenylobacterium sp.]|uniref:TonB-dependent receptor plug domain-containing protein n=1 Tax=Phenylobacterium sp. TaxID=1871053 RepID=UPI002FCC3D49
MKAYLAAASLLALATASPAWADESSDTVDEVIVTGTRSTTRTVTTSLAPIDVLSSEVLQKSGKQSTRDLISTLVPSANTSNSGAGASFAIKTVSLRGLAGDQTLVLVNGKRRHNTAILFVNGTTQNGQSPPDLDLIPSSAVERIEVLRDGASAQYGSDALAGVINIILKDDAEGGGFTALAGMTGKGDGETLQGSLNHGFSFGETGYLNLTLDARTTNYADRGMFSPFTGTFYFPVNGQPDPREGTHTRHTAHPGSPQVQFYSLAYNGGYELSDSIKLYSFGTIASRQTAAWLTYRPPNSILNNVAVYPDGYVVRLKLDDQDWQFALGAKGDNLFSFAWDLSTTLSKNEVGYYENSLNASMGPASPSFFYLGTLTFEEWTTNFDINREFDIGLEKPMFLAIGAEYRKDEFTIGVGEPASYISGGYVAPAGTPLAGQLTAGGSQGVSGFPPFAAGTFERDNKSVYINVEQALSDNFEISLAGRYESYSDFGETTTGKISARWEPFEGIAVRGTASTGFRAPSLQQQHYGSASTINVALPGQPAQLGPSQILPSDNPAAIALGAKPLEPEESTSYSLGLVMNPLPALSATLDVYQIEIKNRIMQSEQLGPNATVSAVLVSQGLNPGQAAFYYANAADMTTKGVDFVVDYRTDFGDYGAIRWTFSANYNKSEFDRITPPPPQLAAAGLVLVGRSRIGDFTVGTPRDKQILSADYTRGRFNANVRVTRYGEVIQRNSVNPRQDETISPTGIVDLDLSYEVTDAVKISLGANNLLDTYPDVVQPANRGGTNPFTYFNQYSPFGITGGFYYTRLNWKF